MRPRPERSTASASTSQLLDLDPRRTPAALRRRVERRAVVPLPRPVRPRAPAALRSPVPRRVGRVRRASTSASRPRPTRRAAEGDIVLVQDYQLSLVPALLARGAAPTCASCTSRTRRSVAPTASACCPTDVAAQLCELARGRPGRFPHRAMGGVVRCFGPRSARPECGDRRAVRGQPRARRRRTRRGRRRTRRTRRRECARTIVVGDRLVILRTDRIEPSKNIVRGFARLRPPARSAARTARARRVRRDGVPVARDAAGVPRIRQRDRAGRRRASTIAGRRATGRRSCSTRATTSPGRLPGCSATTCSS